MNGTSRLIDKVGGPALLWLLGVLFSFVLTLVGVVYGSIEKELDTKANKDMTNHILETVTEVQQDVKQILREMPRK